MPRNPGDRPPGIKEPVPRNTVKAAWNAVVGRGQKLVEKVIEADLRQGVGLPPKSAKGKPGKKGDPNKALPFVELGARLNKELGAGVETGMLPVIINFNSNVDPMKLRRGAQATGEPDDGS